MPEKMCFSMRSNSIKSLKLAFCEEQKKVWYHIKSELSHPWSCCSWCVLEVVLWGPREFPNLEEEWWKQIEPQNPKECMYESKELQLNTDRLLWHRTLKEHPKKPSSCSWCVWEHLQVLPSHSGGFWWSRRSHWWCLGVAGAWSTPCIAPGGDATWSVSTCLLDSLRIPQPWRRKMTSNLNIKFKWKDFCSINIILLIFIRRWILVTTYCMRQLLRSRSRRGWQN